MDYLTFQVHNSAKHTVHFRIFWQSPTPLPTAGKVKMHSYITYSSSSDSLFQLFHFLGSSPKKLLILHLSPLPKHSWIYWSLNLWVFLSSSFRKLSFCQKCEVVPLKIFVHFPCNHGHFKCKKKWFFSTWWWKIYSLLAVKMYCP